MKILHVSDTGLPDGRIERAAMTSANAGHNVYFAGTASASYVPFVQQFVLDWSPKHRLHLPFAWGILKKNFIKIFDGIRPDIIHAHNIFAAKLASEFEYPFVFDDHEHLSLELKAIMGEKGRPIINKKIGSELLKRRMWTEWETELVRNVPTITVGENIAQDYRALGGRVFVVPNLPTGAEIMKEKLNFANKTLSSVYSGKEDRSLVLPFRDMTGLVDLFHENDIGELTAVGSCNQGTNKQHVRYTGFLTRQEMYTEFHKHRVGLLPWKAHWFHRYCNPNKVYEYAHSGLVVMLTSDFIDVISQLGGNCVDFSDYDELVHKLGYFKGHLEEVDEMREKTLNYATEYLLWEKYEKHILESYQLA
jgi:glycosyltransferase involved in cell wall biosynthesis